jgi:hypothetical protein
MDHNQSIPHQSKWQELKLSGMEDGKTSFLCILQMAPFSQVQLLNVLMLWRNADTTTVYQLISWNIKEYNWIGQWVRDLCWNYRFSPSIGKEISTYLDIKTRKGHQGNIYLKDLTQVFHAIEKQGAGEDGVSDMSQFEMKTPDKYWTNQLAKRYGRVGK